MRGKDDEDMSKLKESRITPAYAGKSLPPKVRWELAVDHPRLCGEKFDVSQNFYMSIGSPPPMRGKVSTTLPASSPSRITPAYAGKRAKKSVMRSAGQDHPRLCGEKNAPVPARFPEMGSPPPMRGKELAPRAFAAVNRITPAYAGKSPFIIRANCTFWDHPRLCGEKRNGVYNINTGKGSPPPMRGKVRSPKYLTGWSRITPAYAGKSRHHASISFSL